MPYNILAINTGSTSTKLAIYADREKKVQKEYSHSSESLQAYPYVADQLPMRKELIEKFLRQEGASFMPIQAIVARGGLLPPIQSGGYNINKTMVDYLLSPDSPQHASNISAGIAYDLKNTFNVPQAFIYDGVSTDEMELIARISGIPDMPRIAITHALNMRATAIKVAEKQLGKPYGEAVLLVAHLGGGISFSLHKKGRVVDIIADDEGAFAPESSGGQQSVPLLKYMSNIPDLRDQLNVIRGNGGIVSYFGTSDMREIEEKIKEGDEYAELVYDAMAYQTAKSIGALSVVPCGKIDGIVLTGGLAYSERFTNFIKKHVSFIAPVFLCPGENEMEALAMGANRILTGAEKAKEFENVEF